MKPNLRGREWASLLDLPFLIVLGLLILNDWVWKTAFHNEVTGKLSDFAGLYALVWVCYCMLPRWARLAPWTVAIAFALWKSPVATPFIEGWNSLGAWEIQRVIDYGDLMALAVLPLAALRWRTLGQQVAQPETHPLLQRLVLAVSLVAMVATSYSYRYDYEEKYALDLPIEEVVTRLNQLNLKQDLGNPSLGLHHERANDFRQEGDYRIYLHHNKETETRFDTVFAKIEDSVFVDEIKAYDVPAIDSIYVNPDGVFQWHFLSAGTGIPDSATECRTVRSILILKADGNKSELQLRVIDAEHCGRLIDQAGGKNIDKRLQAAFEQNILEPLGWKSKGPNSDED